MGRSGTSLTASLIHKAGVSLGERLVGPGRANPRGFFEDADFYEFHEQLLFQRGHTILVPPGFRFEPTRADFEQARRLVDARAGNAIWGWKDPRTSLFLEFWREIVPDAHFLLVYRHPLDVLYSLLRSNTIYTAGLLEGLEAWYAYNLQIRSFYERHTGRSILCHSYGIVEKVDTFQRLLAQKFGLDLGIDRELLASVYRPSELHRVQLDDAVASVFTAIHPAAAALYNDLNEQADLPFVQPVGIKPSRAAALAQLSVSLPPALGRSQVRGLLLMLLATIAPDMVEAAFQEFQAYVRSSKAAREWFEGQRASWQSEIDQLTNIVNEQRDWIAELECGKIWSEQQISNYQSALRQEQRVAQELRTWNEQLEKRLGSSRLRRLWGYVRRIVT
jgi:hypothetical protein